MNTLVTIQEAAELPQAAFDLEAIERADLGDNTKYRYRSEIQKYLDTGGSLANRSAIQDHAKKLKPSSRSFFKAALRVVTSDFEKNLKANASPENLAQVQAALLRMDAIRDAVKVTKSKGVKAHTWLTNQQVKTITALCGADIEGKRDWIVLGLLLGAGLRRDELINLTFDALKQQPTKGGRSRDVLQVKGKGRKNRIIPIDPLLASRLREWENITGGGKVARALGRSEPRAILPSLSAVSVFKIVRKYGEAIGMPNLAPHDLRRTYAEIRRAAGEPITRISALLGHANSAVTEKYFNLELDLDNVRLDVIPLSGD
jgi:integrase